MKVKCPSCGKVFDVPKAQDGKMLRCLCRSLFRAKGIEEEAKEVAEVAIISDPDETQETKRKFETSETPKIEISNIENAEPESSLSDQEVDTFLSSLKKSRAEVPTFSAETKSKVAQKPVAQSTQGEGPLETPSLELSIDLRKPEPKRPMKILQFTRSPQTRIFHQLLRIKRKVGWFRR